MEKIYGYKEKDVIGLAEFLKDRGAESLSSIFTKYALINGKAKGTVRNLYYAVAKRSNVDKEFCDKYLGGKPLAINDIAEFDADEEKKLVKQILIERQNGKSVRSVIMRLSNGDAKLALRYQNKFRNLLKNKPELIAEIVGEIKSEGKGESLIDIEKPNKSPITEQQFNRLKVEIDALIGRISSSLKKENQYLKERIAILETENLRLTALLYGREKPTAKRYFKANKPKEFIN
ncbi:MAG: hypothetical protein J6V71_00495 [Clostridia bacterium]|nr:hypothetical protein [Clostridia bacterium]